jgi:predicted metal-dependent enzyme (double-stranded beta helix superfamily)
MAGTRAPSGGATALVERLVTAASEPDFGPERTTALLENALAMGHRWLDERYLRRPADRDWMLYPLYRAPDHRTSMLVAVFGPGITAPVHDHGSWAVIGVYRGRERETWFRRTDDTASGTAHLEPAHSFVNTTGSVHLVPDGTIHTVEALDGVDAVSIHVYGTDIVTQERRTFDLATGREEIYRPDFSDTAAPAET